MAVVAKSLVMARLLEPGGGLAEADTTGRQPGHDLVAVEGRIGGMPRPPEHLSCKADGCFEASGDIDEHGFKFGCKSSAGGCNIDSGAGVGGTVAIEEVQGGLPRPPEVVDVGTSFPCDKPVGVETHLSHQGAFLEDFGKQLEEAREDLGVLVGLRHMRERLPGGITHYEALLAEKQSLVGRLAKGVRGCEPTTQQLDVVYGRLGLDKCEWVCQGGWHAGCGCISS